MTTHDVDSVLPADIAADVAAGKVTLIDVRDSRAWEEGHAAGSVNIPIDELEQRLDEIPADTPIITTCGGGSRGPRAAGMLADRGRDASVLQGGFRAWKSSDLPVE